MSKNYPGTGKYKQVSHCHFKFGGLKSGKRIQALKPINEYNKTPATNKNFYALSDIIT